MSAVKDKLVNVPVGASDVINTVKHIPRTLDKSELRKHSRLASLA